MKSAVKLDAAVNFFEYLLESFGQPERDSNVVDRGTHPRHVYQLAQGAPPLRSGCGSPLTLRAPLNDGQGILQVPPCSIRLEQMTSSWGTINAWLHISRLHD